MPTLSAQGKRPRLSTRVVAFGLVAFPLLGVAGVVAQPAALGAYARVGQPTTGEVADLPPLSAEERVRRAQVVARAGEATLTVGEIENYLAHSTLSEHTEFQTTEGRARIVRDLLRVHLLARAAESRGAVSEATRFAALRAEELALVRIYTEDMRRQAALRRRSESALAAPVQHTNEQRYGVVFRGSRSNAERWTREIQNQPADAALRLAQELGEGVDVPWSERDATPLEGSERDALWGLAEPSQASAPISLGQGRFAVVLLGSIQGGVEIGTGVEGQAYLETEQALREHVEALRAEHVTNYDSARVDGVPFRLPEELSRASMEAITAQIEQTAAEVAEAAAAEAPHPAAPAEAAAPTEAPR